MAANNNNENNSLHIQRNCGGVPGLYLIRDFLTVQEEEDLVAAIDGDPWITNNKARRTQV